MFNPDLFISLSSRTLLMNIAIESAHCVQEGIMCRNKKLRDREKSVCRHKDDDVLLASSEGRQAWNEIEIRMKMH